MQRTKTSLFILPFIEEDYTNPLFLEGFDNAYLNDDNTILCVYRALPKLGDSSITPDGKFAVIHKIKDKFTLDLKRFKEGKYSEFSTEAKLEIGNAYGFNSYPYKVITKHPNERVRIEKMIGQSLKTNQEVCSIIGEEEYYNAKGE